MGRSQVSSSYSNSLTTWNNWFKLQCWNIGDRWIVCFPPQIPSNCSPFIIILHLSSILCKMKIISCKWRLNFPFVKKSVQNLHWLSIITVHKFHFGSCCGIKKRLHNLHPRHHKVQHIALWCSHKLQQLLLSGDNQLVKSCEKCKASPTWCKSGSSRNTRNQP